MGMAVGGKKGSMAEPNIVPLIDVLLVLIIIFMVITPTTPQGAGCARSAALSAQPAGEQGCAGEDDRRAGVGGREGNDQPGRNHWDSSVRASTKFSSCAPRKWLS